MDELAALTYEQKPDFIMLSETWANVNFSTAFFDIPGYEIVGRNDRLDTSSGIGGGLLVYAKNDLAGRVSEFTNPELNSFNQCCAVKVQLDNEHR